VLANILVGGGELMPFCAGVGVESWSGACRLVWEGSCERKEESCRGVMTEESARNSSS